MATAFLLSGLPGQHTSLLPWAKRTSSPRGFRPLPPQVLVVCQPAAASRWATSTARLSQERLAPVLLVNATPTQILEASGLRCDPRLNRH